MASPIFRLRHPGPRELAITLSRLRICAIIAQVATIAAVTQASTLRLPDASLFGGVAALTLFAALVAWRLRRAWPVTEAEVVAHLAVDIGELAYLLYLTGGATNPFVTLNLVPVAVAATALSARYVAAVVALAASAYAWLMFEYVPLAAWHDHDAQSQFNMHVLGMGVNFAISLALLAYFLVRLASALREREHAARRERERALRDEAILAIATQAAAAAHELNTPLSTMRLLLGELRAAHPGEGELQADLALLAAQADSCRDIVRELVAVGAQQLDASPQKQNVSAFASGCSERFRLLRPETELTTAIDANCRALQWQVAAGLQYTLVALLTNAADASADRGDRRVQFGVRRVGEQIEFAVRDNGAGLDADVLDGVRPRFQSHKPHGLGLGLALANATAERLDGELAVQSPDDGGTVMYLRLPLGDVDNSAHADV